MIVSADIVPVLQTAITPAFLLVGIGAMLNLFTGRLSRIIDRSRVLQEKFADTTGREHALIVDELHDLQLRIRTVNRAIYLSSLAAITVCVLIGLLFFMELTRYSVLAEAIAGAFMLSVLLLSFALIQFLREVRISIRDFMIRDEFLERDDAGK